MSETLNLDSTLIRIQADLTFWVEPKSNKKFKAGHHF